MLMTSLTFFSNLLDHLAHVIQTHFGNPKGSKSQVLISKQTRDG